MVYCEPYQSCSLFGAMRYFSNLKNCVTLINGPAGCTFYANNAIVRLNGYFNANEKVDIPKIYCVDFDEKDAILGSEKKLLQAAYELIDRFSPEVLLLFNCCVSEIVGSDIDDVADSIRVKYKDVLVIPFHTAGFKGDHKYGMRLASEMMMEYVFEKAEAEERDYKKVNIMGEFDYFNRSTVELCEILREIGITNINYIPGKSSLAELRNSTNASLNIISCQNASRYLATMMEKKFGIPWLGNSNSLYGIENTFTFYNSLCDFFNVDNTFVKRMKEKALKDISPYKEKLKGKRAVVVAGTRRALGYSSILEELGVKIELLFSEADDIFANKKDFMKYSHNVWYNQYANELSEAIEALNVDFVFSTLPEIVAPIKYLRRPEVDYSGMDGVVRMAEYLADIANNPQAKMVVDE